MASFAEQIPEKPSIGLSRRGAERRWNRIATVIFFTVVAIVVTLPVLYFVGKQLGLSPRTNREEHLLRVALPDDFPVVRVRNETSSTSPCLDYAAFHAFDLIDSVDGEKIQAWLTTHEGKALEEYQRERLFAAPDWFMREVERHQLEWRAVTFDVGRSTPDLYVIGREAGEPRQFLIVLKP
jgi:hypothetical protein